MQIASALAGFTLGEADILRKAMGKKKAEVMATQKDAVPEGLRRRAACPRRRRRKIWDLMEQFAGYGFNKSHSAAYAWLAYQTAYLKANYPAYFMAALLTSERANTDKMVQYIGECREMGIRVLPPDVNQSRHVSSRVRRGAGDIRFGLAAIKNVGEGAVEACWRRGARAGRFRSLFDFCERVDLRAVNRRVIESFVKSGCFDSLDAAPRLALRGHRPRRWRAGQKQQRDREPGQASLFGDAGAGRRGQRERPSASRTRRLGRGRAPGVREGVAGLLHHRPSAGALPRRARAVGERDHGDARAAGGGARGGVGGIVTGAAAHQDQEGRPHGELRPRGPRGQRRGAGVPRDLQEGRGARLADDQVVLVKGRRRSWTRARRGCWPPTCCRSTRPSWRTRATSRSACRSGPGTASRASGSAIYSAPIAANAR